MSLTLSYNLNIDTIESTGSNPSNYSEIVKSLLMQSNSNIIENSKSLLLSYTLSSGQSKTILLQDYGVKFLKIWAIKASNKVRIVKDTEVVEASNLFVDNKAPAIIPTVISPTSITISNTVSEIVHVELLLVFYV